MGQEFRYPSSFEIWKLLWIIGVMVAVALALQHFELPYGNIISSMSSSQKDLGSRNSSLLTNGTSSWPEKAGSVTVSKDLNFADGAYKTDSNNGIDTLTNVNNDAVSEGSRDSNKSSLIDVHGKEPSPGQLIDSKTNTTLHVNNDVVSEGIRGLNKSFGTDNQGKESLPEQLLDQDENFTLEPANNSGNALVPQETERSLSRENITSASENTGASDAGIAPTVPALPSVDSPPNATLPRNAEPSLITPVVPFESDTYEVDRNAAPALDNDGKLGRQQNNLTVLDNNSFVTSIPEVNREPQAPSMAVITISEMNNLQLRSWSSPNSRRPRWPSAVDQELLNAKSVIENAPILENDPMLYAPLYRNISMFRKSYELMEEILKVYVYKEGERPVFHLPLLKGIYASEGWFMRLLEVNKNFVTKDPKKAHLFYLPFSSRNLEVKLYVPDSHSHKNLIQYLKNYLDMISAKYPFWNRTRGADHFLVACHDWAPSETRQHMTHCIRSLCNSDAKEGFVFGKDTALPETYVRSPQKPLRYLGGKPASKRSILAFFAGSMHGYLRPILLEHWRNKDPDMKIFGNLPKVRGKMNYVQYMKSSKYCICARGFEVNSPRVVEAISYECVPVIISDNFVPPFYEVLNWESFAVFVMEKDIPNLKNILLSIPEKRYREMQMRVKKVQHHFLWHARPVRYDMFHMILHSVWYNRVSQIRPS